MAGNARKQLDLVSGTYRGRFLLFVLLLVAHMAVSFLVTKPGHISIDEVTYYLMAKGFSDTGTLEIWNGYDEFPSVELQAVAQLKVHSGRLVSKYPSFYAFVAMPFYRLAGLKGLFLMNSLAFVGVLYLTFRIALFLFQDIRMAWDSSLILGLATYLWEYSQASWPHCLGVLLVLLPFYLVSRIAREGGSRSALRAAVVGLLIGFGAGVRFDVILVLPGLCLMLLLSRPARYRELLTIGMAAVPGLVCLSVTHHLKFGSWAPLTYGGSGGLTSGLTPYLPPAALGALAGVFLLVLRHRPEWGSFVLRRWRAGALTGVLVLVVIPQTRALLGGWMDGLLQLVVDLRFRSLDVVENVQRTSSGALVHLGGLKKSLLQSCPFLSVLLIAAVDSLRRREEGFPLRMLFPVPLTYLGVFSFFAWHGGTCLNQRYLLPALPFLAILTSHSMKKLGSGVGTGWERVSTYSGFGLAMIFVLAGSSLSVADGSHEFFFLTLPLVLSGLLLLLSTVLVREMTVDSRLRGPAVTVLVLCLTWSGLMTLLYDYPRSQLARKNSWEVSRSLDALVEPDSLVTADGPDIVANLKEKKHVRIAVPDPNVPGIAGDDYRDFRPLIDFHLSAGRPVYGIFRPAVWESLRRMNLLVGLEMDLIWEDQHFTTYEIRD